jgi:hypothetical protein
MTETLSALSIYRMIFIKKPVKKRFALIPVFQNQFMIDLPVFSVATPYKFSSII